MKLTRAITTGVAELMDEAGVATWRPDTPYQAGDTAITVGALPDQPPRAVSLTVYGTDDDPQLPDTTVLLQARFRGTTDPEDVNELAEGLFDLLHGRTAFTLHGVPVALARRTSWAHLGVDSNRRWERSDNYSLDTTYPTTHREF